MTRTQLPQSLDQPGVYRIQLGGHLDEGWEDWFGGMELQVSKGGDGRPITTLTGLVRDQVALHGLLARIRDLCLPLLLVQCLDPGTPVDEENEEESGGLHKSDPLEKE